MPEARYEFEAGVSIDRLWDFVSDFANWAECMPGYQRFERIDDDASYWYLKADVGMFQRLVRFHVQVTERREPREVRFTLEAPDENIKGTGQYLATAVGPDRTRVQLHLAMRMDGMLAPVFNALFDPLLPRMLAELAEGLKSRVERGTAVDAGGNSPAP